MPDTESYVHRHVVVLTSLPIFNGHIHCQTQLPRRDETRRDETRRDETRRDETRRDETRRDETRRDETVFLSLYYTF